MRKRHHWNRNEFEDAFGAKTMSVLCAVTLRDTFCPRGVAASSRHTPGEGPEPVEFRSSISYQRLLLGLRVVLLVALRTGFRLTCLLTGFFFAAAFFFAAVFFL